ncbi:MAG TPA: EpsI family protein [Deltaproteobacteria bacterium]|nr:EpsI family protein [Deltaproteobacteria bacterium]HOM29769.1 EpsI family protein [Deltaproteobacteria bacterium]HPP80934.1 EpsI family protein [Deltaproteobacteria bacterium]
MDVRTQKTLALAILILAVSWSAVYLDRPQGQPAASSYELPEVIGQWRGAEVDFDREKLEAWLGTDRMVFREYRNATSGTTVTVYVAYYPALESSDMAHEPEVCYPGQGWSIVSNTLSVLDLPVAAVATKRMVIEKGSRREVVHSWWQTRDRSIARNWSYRLYQTLRCVMGRETSSLWVRVSCEYEQGITDPLKGDSAILAFCTELYPLLLPYFRTGPG